MEWMKQLCFYTVIISQTASEPEHGRWGPEWRFLESVYMLLAVYSYASEGYKHLGNLVV